MAIRVFAWWAGFPFDVIQNVDEQRTAERALASPPHLQIYHVVAFHFVVI